MSNRAPSLLRLAAFGLFVIVSAALGTACGGDVSCEDYCSSIEGEPCEEQFLQGNSCGDFCSASADLNNQYGCTDAFQDFINCSVDDGDACQPTSCIDEIRAYTDCLQCGLNPDDEDC